MQVEDVDVEGKRLYGLATLERLVAPWKLSSLHPEEAEAGKFIVGEGHPAEDDAKYIAWLDELEHRKAGIDRVLSAGHRSYGRRFSCA